MKARSATAVKKAKSNSRECIREKLDGCWDTAFAPATRRRRPVRHCLLPTAAAGRRLHASPHGDGLRENVVSVQDPSIWPGRGTCSDRSDRLLRCGVHDAVETVEAIAGVLTGYLCSGFAFALVFVLRGQPRSTLPFRVHVPGGASAHRAGRRRVVAAAAGAGSQTSAASVMKRAHRRCHRLSSADPSLL